MNDRDALRRWLEDEATAEDDAAEASFLQAMAVLRKAEASATFVTQVSTLAVDARRKEERQLLRVAWMSAGAAAVGVGLAAVFLSTSVGIWAIKAGARAFALAMPWVVAYSTEAVNIWWLIGRIGSPVASVLVSPPAAVMLVGAQVVSVLAFYGLYRIVRLPDGGEVGV